MKMAGGLRNAKNLVSPRARETGAGAACGGAVTPPAANAGPSGGTFQLLLFLELPPGAGSFIPWVWFLYPKGEPVISNLPLKPVPWRTVDALKATHGGPAIGG